MHKSLIFFNLTTYPYPAPVKKLQWGAKVTISQELE